MRVALQYLSSRVETDRGLGHPSDKDASVGMLKILRGGGHGFNPQEIRAWCLQNGWGQRSASELEDFAQRVLDGRRIQTRNSGWKDDILTSWRNEADG